MDSLASTWTFPSVMGLGNWRRYCPLAQDRRRVWRKLAIPHGPNRSPDSQIFGLARFERSSRMLHHRLSVRRSLDWRVILVVDVSGSMEASVIYSALMAAILSGLPSVKTNFVA